MVTTLDELAKLRPSIEGRIGYVQGCFDIIHPGHIQYLESAKKHCDVLIVGIVRDEIIEKWKGENRPIQNQDKRSTIVDAIRYVSYTFVIPEPPNGEGSKKSIVKQLHPHIFVTSAKSDKKLDADFTALLKQEGIELFIDSEITEDSTTEIINRIGMK